MVSHWLQQYSMEKESESVFSPEVKALEVSTELGLRRVTTAGGIEE